MSSISRDSVVLLIPQNDAEAVQILRIARAFKIETLVSDQPHGARLEREPQLLQRLKQTGKLNVVIVEMPGPAVEKAVTDAGFTLYIIDHHRYDELDRMSDENGQPKPSSLEQFLLLFEVADNELERHGFDVRLVRGVGAMDRGFIWALQRDGYSEEEIKNVSRYVYELSREARGHELTELNEKIAREAWKLRKQVGEYLVVTSDVPKAEIRPYLSLLVAQEFGRPTPMVIASRGGLLIYVQDTPKALALFEKFGGFTFGQDTCWGYNNALSSKKLTPSEVLNFLLQ